jgi:UDP-N-acetylglucosamine--N-acetylmuramyl-(pentapeptide) pyrophosphoryl-undecaprenol N-acetylglucosamine transferase
VLQARLRVAHQCREGEVQPVIAAYHRAGVSDVEVASFFSDMADRYASNHLFIGRSGASSVAEAAMAGIPAIFVPLKHKDMQQKYNAESVTTRGGGWIMMQEEFTPEALAQKLKDVLENPAILAKTAAAAKSCARPDAAERLADVVEKSMRNRE